MHNDYPLAPEKLDISHNMSKCGSNIANKCDIKIGGVNKLVPNFCNKRNMFFITEIVSHKYH